MIILADVDTEGADRTLFGDPTKLGPFITQGQFVSLALARDSTNAMKAVQKGLIASVLLAL